MKNIEKILTVLVCSAMAFSVFGCSGKKSGSDSGRSSRDDKSATEETEDADETRSSKHNEEQTENDTVEAIFAGYTDPNIMAMAESYEAAGMTVVPIMASDLDADEYNYVEGFRMFKAGEEDTYMCFVKFKRAEDAANFVKDVWIADCTGYIFHEVSGIYEFSIDNLYCGGIDFSGVMQYTAYEGNPHENTASPEDFKDPQVVELCKEYQAKGFAVEADVSHDGFTAYGVGDDRAHVVFYVVKFEDKDKAVEYINQSWGSMSFLEKTFNDNADGSVSFVFDCDPKYIRTVPIEGTVAADGLLILHYPE